MTTLKEFLLENGVSAVVDPNPILKQDTTIEGFNFQGEKGDFKLQADAQKQADNLGKEIRRVVEEKGAKLTDFSDIKEVMAYDKNPKELSDKELGAYALGTVFAQSNMGKSPFEQGEARYKLRVTDSVDFEGLNPHQLQQAVKLGKQIFGDNNPSLSATDTTTPKSFGALNKNLSETAPKARC
jgi:hypothetical protein